jgi:heterodisulfide reductase subunit B
MTRFAYYPGCSLHGTAREYDESIRAVAAVLDFELREVADWCCCGATPAHAIDAESAHVLGDWNLARATATNAGPLLTGCASCYSRLRAAGAELRAHPATAAAAAARVGGRIDPDLEVLHVAQLLARPAVREAVAAKVTRPLNGLKIACYYGCLLTRPRGEHAFDDAENPTLLEDLVRLAGGEPVAWPLRLDCCGASLALPEPAIVHDLSGKLLAMAHARGAQAMMVACPLCHANLDMTQPAIAKEKKFDFALPILYVTQVIGLALGIDPRTLGLHRHIVPVRVDALIPAREANHV